MRKRVTIDALSLLVSSTGSICFFCASAFPQSSLADGPWSGSIQCQLDVEQQGYVRHETQTWILTSSTPMSKIGDMQIYPATWTVTGQGAVQRTQGQRASMAQWNINVPPANTSIAMFVRAQDKQFIIRIGQRSAPSYTGISAMRQSAENGFPQQPSNISSAVHEWTLPWKKRFRWEEDVWMA